MHEDEPTNDNIFENTVPVVPEIEIYNQIKYDLGILRLSKPGDRSNKDRAFAVSITMFEQALAYFKTYVVDRS